MHAMVPFLPIISIRTKTLKTIVVAHLPMFPSLSKTEVKPFNYELNKGIILNVELDLLSNWIEIHKAKSTTL